MSDHSSLLVERLWKLKRSIDKGRCQGIDFVHLNALLREPAYRADVLRRVERPNCRRWPVKSWQTIRANPLSPKHPMKDWPETTRTLPANVTGQDDTG